MGERQPVECDAGAPPAESTPREDKVPAPPPPSTRRFLLPFLVGLYVCAVLFFGLIGFGVLTETPAVGIGLGLLLVSQAALMASVGTTNLCRPIKQRRLYLPVLIATFMMTLLVLGLGFSLWEFYNVPLFDGWIFWAAVVTSWFVWGGLIYIYTRGRNPYSVLKRITAATFVGSLVQLLATIPAHVIVSRRPGCVVGIGTGIGLTAGLCVMFWSFGPGIFLLFLRKKKQNQASQPQESA